MITKIEINGFKSFSDFKMEFSPLTVIAGTNASGKSNLFDALNLLSYLSKTDLRTAFANKQLRGDVSELFTKYTDDTSASEMRFAIEMLVPRVVKDNWGGVEDVKTPRMRYEVVIAKRQNEQGFEELTVVHEQLSRIATDKDNWAKKYLKKIVNTHSPVLLRWLKEEYNDTDNGVSIWFSKLISYPIDIYGIRRSIRISRISPLTKTFQLSFSEAENKMTLADAIAYLNTENQNL